MPEANSPTTRLDPHRAAVLIRRLLSDYAAAQWKRYATAFALMGLGAICTAVSAYLIRFVINEAYDNRNFWGVVEVSIAVFVIFSMRGLSTYGHSVILMRIGNGIIAEIQKRVFNRLLQQNIGFFSDRSSAEFIARLTAGAQSANNALTLLITAIGRDLFTLIGLLVVMAVQDPVMSFGVFVVAPPLVLVLRKLVRRIRTVAYKQWSGGARVLETFQETLQGMRVVKAFTLEPVIRARFDAQGGEVERESNAMARVGQRVHPLMEGLGGFAAMLIMCYAGYGVVLLHKSPGEFMSFLAALLLAYEPAKRLARFNLDLNAGLAGVRVLFEIMDSPLTEPDEEAKPALALTKACVEFSHVRFAYGEGEPVLRDLSFVAEPGRVTVLVGPSGGGKSTILNLIMRFYEVSGGSVTIDGQDLSQVSRRSLRSSIAAVSQDAFLFRTTVRENIALGRPGASEAEIVAAAKAAHAHDFIMAFPDKYETQVGEHGHKLSGGERQRIAIARALIKDSPIILLDEATAALDADSERHVQAAISELCKGRTTIVIAHRLATVMNADRILVIEAGDVVDAGRHDELLRKGGTYALFYRLQFERQAAEQHTEPAPVAASA